MDISVDKVVAAVPVAVISVHGELDASNYLDLMRTVEEIHRTGMNNVLINLEDTRFISSTGLVALHSIALIMGDKQPLDPGAGWDTFQAMNRNLSSGMQERVKLLNPQPRVARTLERTGLQQFFYVYTDREAALQSFGRGDSTASADDSP